LAFLGDETHMMRGETSRLASTVGVDQTDEEIIRQLQTDGRRPYTQLAKAVGLSEAAVRQRVQRLLESGVMQVVAVTDPMQLGMKRQAMVALRVEGDVKSAADELASIEEVVYVVLTAGSVDLLAEVVVPNDEALLELLNERIRKIPGVVSTETSIYLSLRKQTYQWGTR
jgi:Lrp/AsnC family transcriptional regulator for asnA, asnC and gidA